MRSVGAQNEQRLLPAGWVVKTHQGYYTGIMRSQLERWTPFLKFAKVYKRKAWALKIAEQLGGQIVPGDR